MWLYQLNLRGKAVANVIIFLQSLWNSSWVRTECVLWCYQGPRRLSSYPWVCSCLDDGWTHAGQPGSAVPDMSSLVPSGIIEKIWMRKISFCWVWWQSRSGRERSLGNKEKYLIELLACKSYPFLAFFGVYFFAIDFLFHYNSVCVIL